MRTLTVYTIVTATVREEWRITVSDEDAAAVLNDPTLALDVFDRADSDLEHIKDETQGDETDRLVESVEEYTTGGKDA